MENKEEYILLKDTPEAKKGAKFSKRIIGENNVIYLLLPENKLSYLAQYVENNPEWFSKVIKETPLREKIQMVFDKHIGFSSTGVDNDTTDLKNIVRDKFVNEIEFLMKSLSDPSPLPLEEELDIMIRDHYQAVYQEKASEKHSDYLFVTEDSQLLAIGEVVYGIALQASGLDQWREQKLPFQNRLGIQTPGENRKWFSSKEKANDYLIMNKKSLSISDIIDSATQLNFTSVKYLESLVKERI